MIDERRADLQQNLCIGGGQLPAKYVPAQYVSDLRVDQVRRMACLGAEATAQCPRFRGPSESATIIPDASITTVVPGQVSAARRPGRR